jgi:acyl carrier protein
VALEARLFELDADMMVVFSLVEELFEPEQVDSAFADFVATIETLADGTGWDRVVTLPYEPDPAGGSRLGQLDEQAAGRDSGPLRDDLENGIAGVWEELLEGNVVDRGCDFFAAGGDSLQAVRVLALLAKKYGVRVTVHDFLQAPTVAGLAAVVRANGK